MRLTSITLTLLFLSSPLLFAQNVKTYEGQSSQGSLNIRFEEAVIILEAQLIDRNGNRALDAEENGRILLTVTNQGPGKIYRVRITGYLKN
ncbi:MAG: hypothetical protein P9X24_08250 [Candidatus Hatepunaea meridiana]|nr:hypothetical protein [Candidatus Hatepunaea meridiana]